MALLAARVLTTASVAYAAGGQPASAMSSKLSARTTLGGSHGPATAQPASASGPEEEAAARVLLAAAWPALQRVACLSVTTSGWKKRSLCASLHNNDVTAGTEANQHVVMSRHRVTCSHAAAPSPHAQHGACKGRRGSLETWAPSCKDAMATSNSSPKMLVNGDR